MYSNIHHTKFAHPQKLLPTLSKTQFDKRVSELTQRFGRYFKVREERGKVALIIFPPGHETYEVWVRSAEHG